MVHLESILPLDADYLERLGFAWHTDSDKSSYLTDSLVVISEHEANAYYDATNELYEMFIKAAQYVIDHNLFYEIGIPFNLIELIKISWQSDVHWHLYGRFDFAGGIDGKSIKLLEFNADTPTALFETAVVQWAMLKKNQYDEAMQFNGVYEALLENFKRLVTLEESIETFDERYEGWGFLFSSIRGDVEEENTVKLLQYIATEAGYVTQFAYVDEVEFDSEAGIFFGGEKYELWFKLIPWEDIAIEESEFAMLLGDIIGGQHAIIFNPAYTLLFQSKGILKVLWDLYPNHPLLLESSFEPLPQIQQVKKPFFGREGESVTILDVDGRTIEGGFGIYDNHKMLYQAYTELPTDVHGESYQAGVFFAYEACGVGFRKGGKILNNTSKFVGHIIA